jgi:hypothetical protein
MSAIDQVDHLVYATPDLDATVVALEQLLGVRASEGGRHPGRGTRNALLAIGPRAYLEIVGPDPEQHLPDRSTWFGIDDLKSPKLVTWAAKSSGLERVVLAARDRGVKLGPDHRRKSPAVGWRHADLAVHGADGRAGGRHRSLLHRLAIQQSSCGERGAGARNSSHSSLNTLNPSA